MTDSLSENTERQNDWAGLTDTKISLGPCVLGRMNE